MNQNSSPQPAARSVPDTGAHFGWSRTFIYENLAAGTLTAVKAGRRTLVTTASADALFASLPKAKFRAMRRPAPALTQHAV
jgi:hypothetical protein